MEDNTWNAYACDINETVVLENAQFINSSGLLGAGYNYFVIDGTDTPIERWY
jgi:alpha-galactosidase